MIFGSARNLPILFIDLLRPIRKYMYPDWLFLFYHRWGCRIAGCCPMRFISEQKKPKSVAYVWTLNVRLAWKKAWAMNLIYRYHEYNVTKMKFICQPARWYGIRLRIELYNGEYRLLSRSRIIKKNRHVITANIVSFLFFNSC